MIFFFFNFFLDIWYFILQNTAPLWLYKIWLFSSNDTRNWTFCGSVCFSVMKEEDDDDVAELEAWAANWASLSRWPAPAAPLSPC